MSKTYMDYMNEITADELYNGLFAYGLFSEKLPPIFTAEAFFTYCSNHSSIFEDKERQYVCYESMRNTNVPRSYGIPNPMAYQRLCRCVADNWENMKQHFSIQTSGQHHKVSRIHIRKISDQNLLFEINYKNWRTDDSPEPDLLIGKKYMVTADISNCFPSIYSHSIPWALAGKVTAKTKRNDKEWYNKIDHYCQNCKHGETHGLLIGPHCSNLLSEVILTAVDKKLYDKGWQYYVRNIDDYCCYVATFEEGQCFLSDLSEALHFYGLSLNHKKTAIKELPIASEEQWVRQVNATQVMRAHKDILDYKDVQAYLDSAVGLMKENGMNSAILNYTIKTLKGNQLTKNAEQYYVKTILHLAILYPYLVSLVEDCIFTCYSVDKKLQKKFANAVFADGLRTVNYEAICYAIYFAVKYEFELDELDELRKSDNRHATNTQDCLYKLFTWLYFSAKKDSLSVEKLRKHAESFLGCNEDFEANWLFVYEVLPASKLTNGWKAMKNARVSFLVDLTKLQKMDKR